MAFKQKNTSSTPYWLRWAVLAFLLYAGYLHFVGRTGQKAAGSETTLSGGTTPGQADTVTTIQPGISVSGEIAGTGDPATCGQLANVAVSATKADGSALEGQSGNATLPVGVEIKEKPWAAGLPGMKKGGMREVTFTAQNAFGKDSFKDKGLAADDLIRYRIEMKDLTPSVPPGTLPFRASDVIYGGGGAVMCGDRVRFHLDVWGDDGKLLYSSKAGDGPPFELVAGKSEQLYGLDRGLINMHVGSLRSLIIPPAYLIAAPDAKPAAAIAALPKDKVLMADIQLQEIVAEKKE